METRLHLDHAFKLARQNSNCREERDGCLIVAVNGQILGTGSTGMLAAVGHDRRKCGCVGHCRSSHAEARAVSACGPRINRAHQLYAVHAPCPDCINLLLGTPITEIIFAVESDPMSPSGMLWERAGHTWTVHPYHPQDLKDINHGPKLT